MLLACSLLLAGCGPQPITPTPNPALQIMVPDGTVLEGQGVIPDIQVELDRGLLLQGIDSQLEAAIDCIERQDAP